MAVSIESKLVAQPLALVMGIASIPMSSSTSREARHHVLSVGAVPRRWALPLLICPLETGVYMAVFMGASLGQ
jgi:hypothetical protein